ncbi:hypothetical protein SOVF_169230 [Spinacia oleracea]|nr:hypothetical protein SOVF_169230 [Spinacia oleracea]
MFVDLSLSDDLPVVCNLDDKNVLLKIKKHLGNPSSLSSWDPDIDCVKWNGIHCDISIEGHVTVVRIEDAQDIHGPIPSFFDQLPALKELYFVNIPNLFGPIPSYIGMLTNLTEFTISGTN